MGDPGECSLTASKAERKIRRLTYRPASWTQRAGEYPSTSVSLALKLEAAGWGPAGAWHRRQSQDDLAREWNRLGQWPGGATYSEDSMPAARSA